MCGSAVSVGESQVEDPWPAQAALDPGLPHRHHQADVGAEVRTVSPDAVEEAAGELAGGAQLQGRG